jgi:hypothetical protein
VVNRFEVVPEHGAARFEECERARPGEVVFSVSNDSPSEEVQPVLAFR